MGKFYKKLLNGSVMAMFYRSYLMILLIPIVITVMACFFSSHIVKREIIGANAQLLNMLSESLDNLSLTADNVYNAFVTDETMAQIISTNFNDKRQFYQNVNTFLSNKNSIQIITDERYSFYFYSKAYDSIISASSQGRTVDFFMGNLAQRGFTYDEWMDTLSAVTNKEIRQTGRNSIEIRYPVYGTNKFVPVGVCVFMIEDKFIESILDKTTELKDSSFIIATAESVCVISHNKHQLNLSYDDFPKQTSITNFKVDSKSYVGLVKSSAYYDTKYSIFISNSEFFLRSNIVLVLLAVQLLLMFGIGLYFSYRFSEKNYQPIKNLMASISAKAPEVGVSEFDVIQTAIQEKLRQLKDIRMEALKNKNIIFADNVRKLLVGTIKKQSDFEKFLADYDIKIKGDNFAVVIVRVEDYKEMLKGDYYVDSEEYALYIVKQAMLNIISELSNMENMGMATEVDDYVVLVVNFKENKLSELCETIQNTIKKYLNIETTISVSNPHYEFSSIPVCYREAFDAMEYRVILGSGGIIHFSDINIQGDNFEFPLDKQMKLENFFKTGDKDGAVALIKSVLDENEITSLNPKIARLLIIDIISAVIRSVNSAEKMFGIKQSVWNEALSIEELLSIDTAAELESMVAKVLEVTYAHINDNKSTKNDYLKDCIISYVEKSYSDPNLNVNMLAADLNRNPAYVSRYFKEQTGEGLLDYINRVRVNHAKELLKREDNLNIGEIAVKVGFINSATLIRVFKKYQGITPGQYKKYDF